MDYNPSKCGPAIVSDRRKRIEEYHRKKGYCCPFFRQNNCQNFFRDCEYSHDGTKPLPPGFEYN